jgi:protein-tyrosine phosphatase
MGHLHGVPCPARFSVNTSAPSDAAGRPWRRALAWLCFLAPFFYLTYGLANALAALRTNVPSIVYDWERRIPFVAWTIFPYWSINLFYGLSVFLCRGRHELDRHAARLLTAQVVAVSCFIAVPLAFKFGQPSADGAAGWLFTALRGFDKPFNQAPSLHISLAVILWDLYRRLITTAMSRLLLHVWVIAIYGSVLTTWQHHFFDIPTGALLGFVCVWLWPLERQVAPWRAWHFTRDPQRRRVAFIYGAGALACLALAFAGEGVSGWFAWPAAALLLVALNYAGFGARGFGKHRNEGSAWTIRCMTAPYRVAAWINSRWWTRGESKAVELVPGVWLGRLPSATVGTWKSAVNVAAELDSPCAVPTLHIPALDLVVPSPVQLRRASRAIEHQRAQHGSVLVFCALGYSRSAAAAATWLLNSGRAKNVAQALAIVRAARPRAALTAQHELAIARAWRG